MVKFDMNTKALLTESNVKLLVMKHTGEEVLSYLLQSETENPLLPDHFYLFSPVKLTNIMDPRSGMVKFLMSEWISQRLTPDLGFEIKAEDVLVIADVDPAVKENYVSFTKRLDSYKTMTDEEVSQENIELAGEDGEDEIDMSPEQQTNDDDIPEIDDEAAERLFEYMMANGGLKKTVH